jgi:hypothetical protein
LPAILECAGILSNFVENVDGAEWLICQIEYTNLFVFVCEHIVEHKQALLSLSNSAQSDLGR